MPPKTNQQRIKDLENLVKGHEAALHDMMDAFEVLSNSLDNYVLKIDIPYEETLEARFDSLEEKVNGLGTELDKWRALLDVEGSSEMSVDERFENHRDIIIKLKDRLDEHMFEPGAHDAPHVASLQRKAMRAEAAVRREARKNED